MGRLATTGTGTLIYIGSVLGGPELEGSAIQRALKRIARLVGCGEEGSVGSLDIAFHVPGSLIKPDYSGMRTGRFSRKERMLMIQVSVPVEVTRAGLDEAEAFVIGSLRQAIGMARVVFKKAGIPYPEADYLRLVDDAAKSSVH